MGQAKPKSAADPLAALKKVGITRPYEALLWLPKRHEDYSLVADGFSYGNVEGRKVCIKLTATSKPNVTEKGRFTIFASDSAGGSHKLLQFGIVRFSPWAGVFPGTEFWVRAKVVSANGYLYLNSVEWVDAAVVGTVKPVYAGRTGVLAAAVMTAAAAEAVADEQNIVDAALAIREAFGGMPEGEILALSKCRAPLADMLREIHAPTNPRWAEAALAAAKRIAVAYIRWSANKAGERPMAMKSIIRIGGSLMRSLVAKLPFPLTEGEGSQADAVREVIRLLAEPYPMDALLSADVGVGKTACYGLAAVAAAHLGHKVAVLIPNTVLVTQVVSELRAAFPDYPIAQVTEGVTELPDWSNNPILVGTTKLFKVAERIKWVPDLLVIDEQQKMDESQRNRLRAAHTNVLEATATPIPKATAMLFYGGKQLVQIRKQHAKKAISTNILTAEHRRDMYQRIKGRVASGEQVVIVYPRVSASAADDTKSVIAAQAMWERQFPGKVAMLHGQMSADEKVSTFERVRNGEVPILVTSSIIEVGVTIPNLRFLMVVHAERYGVFTLHQFRGRLARHGGEGECLLYLPEEVDEDSMERLRLLEQTTDGFELAELNMHARGCGDLADSEGPQSGKTATLFHALQLMPRDLEAVIA